MEYYVLIIILVILAIVLILVFCNWCKLILNKFGQRANPETEPKLQQNNNKQHQIMDSPAVNEIEDISVSFINSKDSNSSLGLLFRKYELKEKSVIMKIRVNQVSYYKLQEGRKQIKNIYLLKYDDSFNESVLHYEKTRDKKMKIYEYKSNQSTYEGRYDANLLKFYQSDPAVIQGVRKYNQSFPAGPLNFNSVATLDAFALHLNLEEEKVFLSNQSQRIWFAQSTTIKNGQFIKNLYSQLENEFWQFRPISYQIQIFCSQVFFIINDGNRKYLIEVNFTDYITIHDSAPQGLEYYQHILVNLKQFFEKLEYVVICPSCRNQEESMSIGLDLCLRMIKYSNQPNRGNINSPELMKQYLQNQLFRNMV